MDFFLQREFQAEIPFTAQVTLVRMLKGFQAFLVFAEDSYAVVDMIKMKTIHTGFLNDKDEIACLLTDGLSILIRNLKTLELKVLNTNTNETRRIPGVTLPVTYAKSEEPGINEEIIRLEQTSCNQIVPFGRGFISLEYFQKKGKVFYFDLKDVSLRNEVFQSKKLKNFEIGRRAALKKENEDGVFLYMPDAFPEEEDVAWYGVYIERKANGEFSNEEIEINDFPITLAIVSALPIEGRARQYALIGNNSAGSSSLPAGSFMFILPPFSSEKTPPALSIGFKELIVLPIELPQFNHFQILDCFSIRQKLTDFLVVLSLIGQLEKRDKEGYSSRYLSMNISKNQVIMVSKPTLEGEGDESPQFKGSVFIKDKIRCEPFPDVFERNKVPMSVSVNFNCFTESREIVYWLMNKSGVLKHYGKNITSEILSFFE